ncbi:CBS domain-containing protein [Streptomyces chiangmaiensis]|uniref:CBS domain-containing protein n=1 Tax=Streptomyces chiangmaiensis TaxID=766497 RepID=A0ABU7FT27_9ACTN|nr:CBS domain-containing protein [Streptomyces chiangmaiensis]MED7827280.1 CBS domain-containing protein [Streptomyces chiangmaiensis]
MKVSDAMSAPAAAVPPRTSLAEAARQMDECGVGSVLVVEGGTLRGIVTDRDLAVRGLGRGLDGEARVEEVMSPQVITVSLDDDIYAAYRILRRSGVRRLPVLDEHRPVGMLTVDDLLLDIFQRVADLLGPVSWSILEEPPGPPSAGSPAHGM